MAFALGALAIAAFLRERLLLSVALVAVAGAVHPTTALWFGVWFVVAAWIAYPGLRKPIAGLAVLGMVLGLWALVAGPLAGRLAVMDPEWRATLVTRDYLFPLEWPLYPWVINLAYPVIIGRIYTRRVSAGVVDVYERGIVLGSASLLAVFAVALVLHAFGVTIAIQLQPARVFWMFDFVATIYVVWLLAEGLTSWARTEAAPYEGANVGRRLSPRPVVGRGFGPRHLALIILCLAAVRGAYVLVESERPVVQVSIPDDDWGRVMAFAKTTPKDSHWLAHPIHAALYGTSVRIAGERDVFVEGMKDIAIGMYDRKVAMRTAERLALLADFDSLDAAAVRRLAATYDLDYMVTESPMDLPLAFESGRLRVYLLS
jgi:hypothetical protein